LRLGLTAEGGGDGDYITSESPAVSHGFRAAKSSLAQQFWAY
jgi:hypothetical protein